MCAICDANIAHEVFNPEKQTPSGKIFLEWINPQRPLIVGGKLRKELFNKDDLRKWASTAIKRGELKMFCDTKINKAIKALEGKKMKSNDLHIIALAKVSGARLLYSEDQLLKEDFKKFINNPKGKIYPKGKKEKGLGEWLKRNKQLCSSRS